MSSAACLLLLFVWTSCSVTYVLVIMILSGDVLYTHNNVIGRFLSTNFSTPKYPVRVFCL